MSKFENMEFKILIFIILSKSCGIHYTIKTYEQYTNYPNYLHYCAWWCKVDMLVWSNEIGTQYKYGEEGKLN